MKNFFLVCVISVVFCFCRQSFTRTEQFAFNKETIVFRANFSLEDTALVYSNQSWTVENVAHWVHTDRIHGLGTGSIPFRVDTNRTTITRSTTITLYSAFATTQPALSIIQLGGVPVVSFSKEKVLLGGGTNYDDTIMVYSNGPWEARSTEEWLKIEKLTEEDTTLVRLYTSEPNYGLGAREANFEVVTTPGVIFDVDVSQSLGIEIVAGGNGTGDALNQLDRPGSVTFNKDSTGLFVADPYNYRIMFWSFGASEGTIFYGTGTAGSAINELNIANDIQLVDGRYLYISDLMNNRVLRTDIEGNTTEVVAGGNGAGSASNQLNEPLGFTFNQNDDLIVAEIRNHRVTLWREGVDTGVVIAGGNGAGNRLDQLNNPFSVEYLKNDNSFLVADNANNRIMRWEAGSSSGTIFADNNSSPNSINSPYSIKVGPDGRIYVANFNDNNILVFPANFTSPQQGEVFLGNGIRGGAINEFNQPNAISFDNRGNLYVSDYNNSRVVRYLK